MAIDKKDFPGFDEGLLSEVLGEEKEVETSSPATTEQEETEETQEESQEQEETEETPNEEAEGETETEPPAEKGEKTVSLKALHEERNKRKAEKARADALAIELEAIKNKPTQQPVQQQTPEQQQDISEWVEQQAEREVRERLKVTEDLDQLQFTDPVKYRKVTKEIAKAEFRIEADINQRNEIRNEVNQALQEFNSQPDYKEVDSFALQTLDDLPV